MSKKNNKWKQHTSIWNPGEIKTGRTHNLSLWDQNYQTIVDMDGKDYQADTAELFGEAILHNRFYALCHDPKNTDEFPFLSDLLSLPYAEPILTNGDKELIGIRFWVKGSRNPSLHGCLIKMSAFGLDDFDNIHAIGRLFDVTGFEGPSISSVAEKHARSSLQGKSLIHRPMHNVRSRIIDNRTGARMHGYRGKKPCLYDDSWEYDFNLSRFSLLGKTPNPYRQPEFIPYGSTRLMGDEPAFVHARVKIKASFLGPLPMPREPGKTLIQYPNKPGQEIEGWWWREVLQQAIDMGSKVTVIDGYLWDKYSDWLSPWQYDLGVLMNKTKDDPLIYAMVKNMSSAFIGKNQSAPVTSRLISAVDSDMQNDSIIPTLPYQGGLNLAIRHEPDLNKKSLIPQAEYIVAMEALRTYQLAYELDNDYGIPYLRIHTDSVRIAEPMPQEMYDRVNELPGNLKEVFHPGYEKRMEEVA